MNDGELRRVLYQLVAQKIERVVESQLSRHDAVIVVEVVVLHSRTHVKGTDTYVPLFFETLFLGACILVSERSVYGSCYAREAVARACVVTSRNGKVGNVGIIGKTFHPVLGMKRRGEKQKQGKRQRMFHCAKCFD